MQEIVSFVEQHLKTHAPGLPPEEVTATASTLVSEVNSELATEVSAEVAAEVVGEVTMPKPASNS